ncbi:MULTISPECIES: carbohydrate porin [Salinivibrio]|uniref:Maltoporin n=1 Tax=Salinivibrio costicola TaxID=51367 RepID=A0ABX6KAT9_SALCS|nr:MULTISPECIES: carbohydrate porin [Salinivibrio]ODP97641.1 maltoporin [Salinivibrio sp. DV]PCE65678.1 maltoporin [Salinivibrio sp. YCSC6]QCF37870.1 maltoporin [Salinivibrio sp. YCSC6]QIR07461.1 maltoporin [Salinivibrio costicola]
MRKVSLLAAAVATALASGVALADNADKNDGWEVHGYGSMNFRMVDGETVDTEFGRPDYKTAGTHGQSTNQVEFTVKKHSTYDNGAWADYVVRSEYGNGNSYAYTSSGSQKKNDEAQFEVKEAYVELGGLSFMGKDTSIWGGQRYLNRAAGLLSGEYWKQSSGVGAGLQTKLNGHTAGAAIVVADPDAGEVSRSDDRTTLTSYDLYYYGVDVGIGSLDFDFKYMEQANKDSNSDDGFGAAITLNSSYYGMDGWTQTAIAYGKGVAQNRGVNFGGWSGGDENQESIFLTSYGVMNISDNWQMGSELTYFAALDQLFGADDLKRYIAAVRPSYKVNENMRLETTLSYGHEEGADGYWGRSGDAVESDIWNVEVAVPLTVNADFFGRPQIKPYISYIKADDKASGGQIGIDNSDDETVIGVHTEIWF